MRVLVDVNIFQDVLSGRAGSIASIEVLQRIEEKREQGVVSALTVSILWFLNHKANNARQLVLDAVAGCEVLSLTRNILDRAFANVKFEDVEDAIQHETAASAQCDCIVTRDASDFHGSALAVYTPEHFLSLSR